LHDLEVSAMSRLVAAVLFVIVLVFLAHLKGPETSGRCCPDRAHRMVPGMVELEFCPVRAR
jgi:hypothetical protein